MGGYHSRMNTIVLSLEEAARDLASVVDRLHASGKRAVLMSGNEPIVEITPVSRSETSDADLPQSSGTAAPNEEPGDQTGPRVVYCSLTGLPVVMGRPGQRMVTSEEIYEELRNSFP
jgi:antitoxin (DNA-binding transcriptional repressor) of toxin-antitoxin stability system